MKSGVLETSEKIIKSKTKTVRELLNNRYTLDYYQREYNWQKEQVEELLDDLTNKFLENYKENHDYEAVDNYSHYFLGSIVISKKEKTNEQSIVDGQQRLTTLMLFLINLYHISDDSADKSDIVDLILSEESGKISFSLDVPERAHCLRSLYENKSFDDSNEPESIRNIVACSDYIKGKFPEELRGQPLPYFLDWLLDKVYFVEITAPDDDDAYTIFETMNDRGLPLNPTDMLKGYLLTKMTSFQRDSANETWRNRIQDLHNLGKDEAENAIKAWLRSQYAKRQTDFNLIGNKFHRWVRNQASELGLISSDDFADFIERDFEFYSHWYCRLQQAAQSLTPGLECVYYNAQHNFTLQYSVLLTPLLIGEPEGESIRKIQIVARYLDIFIHRYLWNYRSIQQNSMVKPMFSLIRDIRGKNTCELAKLLYEKLKEDDVTFAHNSQYGLQGNNRPKIRLMLARITDYVETQSGQNSCYQEYIKYDIEHIWANRPELHDKEFDHEYDFQEYRDRIGGLLLLPPKRNKDFSNKSYEDKLEDYLNENLLAQSLHERTYERNTDFQNFIQRSRLKFHPCPNFKKANLDDRQKLYQQLAKRIWNPERLRIPYGEEPEIAVDFDSDLQQGTGTPDKAWTIDRVKYLVPQERKEHYETQHKNKVGVIYAQVAELLNLVEKKGWDLSPKFQKSYCALYVERRPIFGVTFSGSPRFAVWIEKQEVERLSNHCKFERYSDPHGHAIYPLSTSLDELLPIFEFAYSRKIADEHAAFRAEARSYVHRAGSVQGLVGVALNPAAMEFLRDAYVEFRERCESDGATDVIERLDNWAKPFKMMWGIK
ncbi:DUF262 domain-containing protein [Candidatus Poribacteria bacterium]|nr:DUF262 domain-containing protein [Candidatus Poribacteria bacterium]MYK21868.1 DUF262 domain-containing protein [Candidatus Poribacteria bacterium]